MGATPVMSDLSLLRDIQGIIHLDTQLPYCGQQFGVPKYQLNSTKVLAASIDHRYVGPSHQVRAVVGEIQSELYMGGKPILKLRRPPSKIASSKLR